METPTSDHNWPNVFINFNDKIKPTKKLLCSKRSNKRVDMFFLNKTERDVHIVWLDFQGKRKIYETLRPGFGLPMTSYEHHPWLVEDSKTGEKMLCNGKYLYIPLQETSKNDKIVKITLPFYSLQELAVQVVRDNINHFNDIESLELPSLLLDELKLSFLIKTKMLSIYNGAMWPQ